MTKHSCKLTETKAKPSRVPIPQGYALVPPDGGWAWIVLVGCFIAGLNTVAAMSAFAVILNDLTAMFSTTTATLSWIPSVAISTGQFLGPVSTVVINKCGCRKAVILGGILISSGITLSYFATTTEHLILTYGAIAGMGSGLCHTTYPVVLSQYFKKYYGIAIGCLVSSFAASRLILTPLAQLILDEYGCRATMLLMGTFALHICVGGCLLQPAKWHSVLAALDPKTDGQISKAIQTDTSTSPNTKSVEAKLLENEGTKETEEPDNESNKAYAHPPLQFTTSLESMNVIYATAISTSPSERPDGKSCSPSWCLKGFFCKSIDHSLLKEPLFYVVCLNGLCVLAIMIFGNLFLFPLGIEIGLAPMETASVISGKAIADIFGRLAGPPVVTLLKLPTRYSYIILNFIHALILAAFFLAGTYEVFVSLAILSGLIFGVVISLNGVLMIECMGAKRLSSVLGLSAFLQGFLMLPMAPIMGWIRDTTGSFINVFLFLSALQAVVVILWILKPLITKYTKKR